MHVAALMDSPSCPSRVDLATQNRVSHAWPREMLLKESFRCPLTVTAWHVALQQGRAVGQVRIDLAQPGFRRQIAFRYHF